MEKDIKNLNQQECYDLYLNMRKHSDIKWRSSMRLRHIDKGTAISTQIVCIEELIKSFILFLDSKGMHLRKMEYVRTILQRDHAIRHFFGFLAFTINIIMDDFFILLKALRENPNEILKYVRNKEDLELRAKWYLLRKVPVIKKEFYWFSQIERLRQEGNHYDINPTTKSPLELNDDDFREVNKRLNKVRNLIRYTIMAIERDSDKMFQKIGIDISEEKKGIMYSQMNDWIRSAVKTKGGIFKFVEKSASGMQKEFNT